MNSIVIPHNFKPPSYSPDALTEEEKTLLRKVLVEGTILYALGDHSMQFKVIGREEYLGGTWPSGGSPRQNYTADIDDFLVIKYLAGDEAGRVNGFSWNYLHKTIDLDKFWQERMLIIEKITEEEI